MLEFPGEGVNLRKSAVFCENLRFGLSLSPQFRPLKRAPSLFPFSNLSTESQIDTLRFGTQ